MMTLMHIAIGFTIAHANTETGTRVPDTMGYHQARARLTEVQPSSEDRRPQLEQYHAARLKLTRAPEVQTTTPSTEDRRPQNMQYHQQMLQILRMSEAGAPTSDVMNYHLQMLKARSGNKQAYEPALERQLDKYINGVYRQGAPKTRAQISMIDEGACVVASSARGEDASKCGEVIKVNPCLKQNKSAASCVSDFVASRLNAPTVTRVAEADSADAGR